jgi:pyruvate dehydrogenase E2 component (dihydrolipoamide acetyltransferase)
MPNLELEEKRDLSPFRKIAIGTWETTYDPQVYGTLDLRMEKALAYVDAFRAATGKRLTLSHMMAKASGVTLRDMPDANAILRFNRIFLRKRIGVFFQVAMKDPKTGEIDLSGATIHQPETKTLEQIVDEFEDKVGRVRADEDKAFKGSRDAFRSVPFFALNRVMKTLSGLSYTMNLDMRWAGIPRDPFGSMMITNIGSLGLNIAYVPLVPYSRVPLLLAMGAVEDRPVVEGGAVVPGKVMSVNATFDHRVLDGVHVAKMAKTLRAWMEDPFTHFDPLPGR